MLNFQHQNAGESNVGTQIYYLHTFEIIKMPIQDSSPQTTLMWHIWRWWQWCSVSKRLWTGGGSYLMGNVLQFNFNVLFVTVDRMIRENSHIFTDAQCKVCSAMLISESQKLAHYQVLQATRCYWISYSGCNWIEYLLTINPVFFPTLRQSKKHANKVRRYMSIHGEEELNQGKKIKLETKQVM